MEKTNKTIYVKGHYEEYWDKAVQKADGSPQSLSIIVGTALQEYFDRQEDE